MKKMMILAVLFIASAPVFAQFTYGVKGGLNLSSLSKMKTLGGDDSKMKASVYFGAFAEYQISDYVGISPEIVYSRQGFAAKNDGVIIGQDVRATELKAKYRFNYLDVPVLVKLYVADGLSVDLGPQFGFLLNAKYYAKSGSTKVKEKLSGVKGFDMSLAMGLTYDISRFFVQGRYNLGLSNVIKKGESKDKHRNNVVQLGVGYRF
ncbi:MAG: PorT family protein [Culturomica sp.]|jgi:hypothetical protein|nr:PorT family protein [Culturomica sp.]